MHFLIALKLSEKLLLHAILSTIAFWRTMIPLLKVPYLVIDFGKLCLSHYLDSYVKTCLVDDELTTLEVIDIAGQEEFRFVMAPSMHTNLK